MYRFERFVAFGAFAAMFLCLTGLACASDKVTFAFFPRQWPPFEVVVDGQPVGAGVEIFKVLMPKDVEVGVEMVPSPRSTLHDLKGPVYTRLESRDWVEDPEAFLWSDPVLDVASVVYSAKHKPYEYDGDESLHGLTIGCIRQFEYPGVEHLFKAGKAKRYDVNSDLVLLRMIKAGRVDVGLFDDLSAAWLIHNTEDVDHGDFHIAKKPIRSAQVRFVFNMNEEWRKRLPEINRLIRKAHEDGTIDSILGRYR